MTDFDKKRLTLLYRNKAMQFANPETIQQADALEALENLNPKQRTELLADMLVSHMILHSQIGQR